MIHKRKKIELDFIKIKNLRSVNDIKRMKTQAVERGKIFANHISHEDN